MLFNNLKEGERTKIKGAISQRRYIKSEKKNHYLLKVSDEKNTEVIFYIYENTSLFPVVQNFKETQTVEVDITLHSLEKMEAVLHYIQPCELVNDSYVNDEKLKLKLKSIILEMKSEKLKRLVVLITNEKWWNDKFLTAPASKKHGYAFKSGLLARTIRTIMLAHSDVDTYNNWEYNLKNSPKLSKDLCTLLLFLEGARKAFIYEGSQEDYELNMWSVITNPTHYSLDILSRANERMKEDFKMELSENELNLIRSILGSMDDSKDGNSHEATCREAVVISSALKKDLEMSNFEQLDRSNKSGVVRFKNRYLYAGTFENIQDTLSIPVKEASFSEELEADLNSESNGYESIELKEAVNEFL